MRWFHRFTGTDGFWDLDARDLTIDQTRWARADRGW
jgi:hypothetical protein